MLPLLYALFATARSSLPGRPQRELALENLALRQQLAILRRKTKSPKLTKTDRAFWVALSRLWPDWQSALILVKPETVIGWHRKGFKLCWRWRSRNRGGSPPIDAEIRRTLARVYIAAGMTESAQRTLNIAENLESRETSPPSRPGLLGRVGALWRRG